IQNFGLQKQVDLLAYDIPTAKASDRSVLLMDKLEERLKRSGIHLRLINLKDFKNEAEKIKRVYNKAWDKNLGFVPMTDEEFAYIAKVLQMIVNPIYCIIVEMDNEIVGFAVGIKYINEFLIKIKRSILLPTGIFNVLIGRKKNISLL